MDEPIILSRAYHPINPTEIEKIVLEVLEKMEDEMATEDGYVQGVFPKDFPNVAREVAERLSATREI